MTTTVRVRASELIKNFGPHLYREAYGKRMSLSAWLEQQDPSSGYNDGLDAFGRLLMAAGIRVNSVPEAGIWADTFEAFDKTPETRALVHEWMSRQWRSISIGSPYNTRSILTSYEDATGTSMKPYVNAARMRYKQLAAPIPLEQLIAYTTAIDGDSYRAYYLTDSAPDQRMVRVNEGAEIPRSKLVGGDHTIKLYKFGRGFEATYETLRRQPIDRLAVQIARMAIQAETDKVATVIDVMVNGDGNSGTSATNYNLTSLDSGASAGTLTLKGWLAFKMKFAAPYAMTSALAQEAVALQMQLLSTGNANIPLVMVQGASNLGSFKQMNPGLADGVALGWTADAPSLKIVAFDNRFAVERVTEIGGNITEVEKFVSRQTQGLFMTEVEGYDIFNQDAVKTLNVNA